MVPIEWPRVVVRSTYWHTVACSGITGNGFFLFWLGNFAAETWAVIYDKSGYKTSNLWAVASFTSKKR